MQARKKHLARRIADVGTANTQAQQDHTPLAAAPVTATAGSAASPPSVQVMPLAQVVIRQTGSQYVTAGMEDLTPIWTPDGAGIPATAPGRWGQLTAAGRP